MTNMDAYFAQSGDKPSALAARIGRATSTITRALKGERNVTYELALAVEAGTGGAVTADAFMADCLNAWRASSSEDSSGEAA